MNGTFDARGGTSTTGGAGAGLLTLGGDTANALLYLEVTTIPNDVETSTGGSGTKIIQIDNRFGPSTIEGDLSINEDLLLSGGGLVFVDGTAVVLPTPPTGYEFNLSGTQLTLDVASGSAFDTWATGLSDPSFAGTPDDDGIANGLKWTLGGAAGVATTESALVTNTQNSTSGLTFDFERIDDSESEVTLEVEYGNDLTTFPDGTVTVGAASSGPDGNGVTVTVAENGAAADTVSVNVSVGNASAGGELFGRIKVTQN